MCARVRENLKGLGGRPDDVSRVSLPQSTEKVLIGFCFPSFIIQYMNMNRHCLPSKPRGYDCIQHTTGDICFLFFSLPAPFTWLCSRSGWIHRMITELLALLFPVLFIHPPGSTSMHHSTSSFPSLDASVYAYPLHEQETLSAKNGRFPSHSAT